MNIREIKAQLERVRYAGEQDGIIKGLRLAVDKLSGTFTKNQADLMEELVQELIKKWELEDAKK